MKHKEILTTSFVIKCEGCVNGDIFDDDKKVIIRDLDLKVIEVKGDDKDDFNSQ